MDYSRINTNLKFALDSKANVLFDSNIPWTGNGYLLTYLNTENIEFRLHDNYDCGTRFIHGLNFFDCPIVDHEDIKVLYHLLDNKKIKLWVRADVSKFNIGLVKKFPIVFRYGLKKGE